MSEETRTLLNKILYNQREEKEHRRNEKLSLDNLSDRVKKLEGYLKSDSETNTEGVVEKLNNIEKKVSKLETKAAVFGAMSGAAIFAIKWIVSKLLV